MANDWQVITLDQLGRIVTGKTPPSAIVDAFGGDMPFITPSDMNGARIISTTIRSLSSSGQAAVKNSVIPKNAVMVSCIGSDMGKAAIAGVECTTNQQINSIIVDADNSPEFVYYNLSLRKAEIRGSASGSAQPILNKSAFGQLEIKLPPLAEQRAIAHVLGTLDDKIELNRKQNETLEAMASTLFKAWFVDFEPVRAKMEGRWQRGQSLPGLPEHLYDLFPDSLVDSELGEIPEEWECVAASRLIEFNPSEALRKDTEAPYIEMAALPTSGSFTESPVLRPFGSGTRFRNGDTLLARITPCLENGKTAFVQCLPDNTVGWGSTEYIVMRPKLPVPQEFGYLLARDAAFREQAIRSMTGTSGRQRVQADSVAAFKLAAPSNEAVWDAFSRVVAPAFISVKANAEEIATLSQLRDTLLPKLISGELRVLDAERIVGA